MADMAKLVDSEMDLRHLEACHRIGKPEEIRLARRRVDCGMAALIEESVIPRESQGRLIVGGFSGYLTLGGGSV